MFTTQAFTVLSFLAGASLVNAHGYVVKWTFNGEAHEGVDPNSSGGYSGAQRPLDNSEANGNGWGPSNFPVSEFPAKMVCGGMEAGSGLTAWDLDAGSTVTAEWTGPKNGNDAYWPTEHHGPAIEYMARCPSDDCNGVAADSLDWFKIQQDSWDGSQWPSDTIRSTQEWSFTIPADIAPGAYLVRHEQMALHWAYEQQPGKGFEVYPHCFQANVKGSGTAVPTDTVRIPDIYKPDQYASYKFAVADGGKSTWGGEAMDSYVPPGGPVYAGGAAPAPAPSASAPASQSSAATPSASASTPGGDDENTTPTDVEPMPSATDSAETPEETDSTEVPDDSEDEEDEEEEESASTPAPVPSSTAATSTRATKTRTRGWWRSSATTAAATEDEVSRRNVIARYAPRQLGIVA